MEAFGIRGLFGYLAAVAALFALVRGLSVHVRRVKCRRPFLLVQTIFAHDLAHAADGERPR